MKTRKREEPQWGLVLFLWHVVAVLLVVAAGLRLWVILGKGGAL